MSAIQNKQPVWPPLAPEGPLSSKYEKCRHIAEEIYKRIDITFQIKSLATGSQSDISDQSDQIEIDSNDLSNGTDLFAYEKSDSIPSSTEQDDKKHDKLINLNNNEIKKSIVPIYKPPRKRFRKKVKKRQSKGRSESEGSSDEAPLSRMADVPPAARAPAVAAPPSDESDRAMGVPDLSAVTAGREPRLKVKSMEKEKSSRKTKAPETITRFHDTPAIAKTTQPVGTIMKPLDLASEGKTGRNPVNFTKPYLPECRVNIEVCKPMDFSAAKVFKDNKSAKESKAEKAKADFAKSVDKSKTAVTTDSKSDTKTDTAKSSEMTAAVIDKVSKKKEPKDGGKTTDGEKGGDWKKCSMCSLPCRGERGLRRHMSLSHILVPDDVVRPKTRKSPEERSV